MSSLTNSDPRNRQDCSLLMAALQQVQPTLRELDLSLSLYSSCNDQDFDSFKISVKGQLGPLQVFSRLRKLKAPIVTLLGWSPDKFNSLRLAEVLPRGLTHLGLTDDLSDQYTYEWNKGLVLGELNAFLDVWRSVTPDLQAMEFWMSWEEEEAQKIEPELRRKCEKAGVLCTFPEYVEGSYSTMGFQWVRHG